MIHPINGIHITPRYNNRRGLFWKVILRILSSYTYIRYEFYYCKRIYIFLLYLSQNQNQKLQENGEKLETELLCLKTADINGTISPDNEESFASNDSSGGSAYKQRYERASRELEYTKRRLQQQHHDDLEQLVALRKQLEKKVGTFLRF